MNSTNKTAFGRDWTFLQQEQLDFFDTNYKNLTAELAESVEAMFMQFILRREGTTVESTYLDPYERQAGFQFAKPAYKIASKMVKDSFQQMKAQTMLLLN